VCPGTSRGFAKRSSACMLCSLNNKKTTTKKQQRRAPPFLIIGSLQPPGRQAGLRASPRREGWARRGGGAEGRQQKRPGGGELLPGSSVRYRRLPSGSWPSNGPNHRLPRPPSHRPFCLGGQMRAQVTVAAGERGDVVRLPGPGVGAAKGERNRSQAGVSWLLL